MTETNMEQDVDVNLDDMLITFKELLKATGIDPIEVDACTTMEEIQNLAEEYQKKLLKDEDQDILTNLSEGDLESILNADEVINSVSDEELSSIDAKINELMQFAEVQEVFSEGPEALFKLENIVKLENILNNLKKKVEDEKNNFNKEVQKAQLPQGLRLQMFQQLNKTIKPLMNDIKMFETLIEEIKKTREVIIEAIRKQYPQEQELS